MSTTRTAPATEVERGGTNLAETVQQALPARAGPWRCWTSGPLLQIWEDPVHLLVPIVVVDELDGLKNRGSGSKVKWRAGYTLAVLDRVFASSTRPVQLAPEDSRHSDRAAFPAAR